MPSSGIIPYKDPILMIFCMCVSLNYGWFWLIISEVTVTYVENNEVKKNKGYGG